MSFKTISLGKTLSYTRAYKIININTTLLNASIFVERKDLDDFDQVDVFHIQDMYKIILTKDMDYKKFIKLVSFLEILLRAYI